MFDRPKEVRRGSHAQTALRMVAGEKNKIGRLDRYAFINHFAISITLLINPHIPMEHSNVGAGLVEPAELLEPERSEAKESLLLRYLAVMEALTLLKVYGRSLRGIGGQDELGYSVSRTRNDLYFVTLQLGQNTIQQSLSSLPVELAASIFRAL